MSNTITLQPHERDLWGRVYAARLGAVGAVFAAETADAAVLAMREREPAGSALGDVDAAERALSSAAFNYTTIPPLPDKWEEREPVDDDKVRLVRIKRPGHIVTVDHRDRVAISVVDSQSPGHWAPACVIAYALAVAAQRRPGGDR